MDTLVTDRQEQERLLRIKTEFINTTSTPGWAFIRKLCDNLIKRTNEEAVESFLKREPHEKSQEKLTYAQAMAEGLNHLFNAIEAAKLIEFQPEDLEDLGNADLF